MKKLTALVLAALMALGMASLASAGEPIEIRLLTRMAGTSKQVLIYQEVIDKFKADYPEVTIIDDSQGDESAFNNILKTDLSSGTLANIFRIQGVANLGKYIDEGYLLNVEPFIKDDAVWGGGFAEGALNYYRVPGKDGIYAVPCEGGLIGVYYNERLFKENGIDKFPETWNELKSAIAVFKDKNIIPIALGAKASYMAGHLHNQIFYKWLGTDAAKALGNRTLSWTDPSVVETLGFVKELVDAGAFPDGSAGLSDDMVLANFQNGEAAMMITGPWNITRFNDPELCPEYENIRLAKFPYFEEKPEFKDNDMQIISPYMINGKLEGRALELTIELVKRLTSSETASRFANEAAQLIPRNDIQVDQANVDPLFQANVDLCATSTGVAVDVFDYDPLPSMQDKTRNALVGIFTGSTPEQAAEEIQAEVDKG
ncbi:ABC transporter substrate-binding protein [Bacillota bacterium Meth-B3]